MKWIKLKSQRQFLCKQTGSHRTEVNRYGQPYGDTRYGVHTYIYPMEARTSIWINAAQMLDDWLVACPIEKRSGQERNGALGWMLNVSHQQRFERWTMVSMVATCPSPFPSPHPHPLANIQLPFDRKYSSKDSPHSTISNPLPLGAQEGIFRGLEWNYSWRTTSKALLYTWANTFEGWHLRLLKYRKSGLHWHKLHRILSIFHPRFGFKLTPLNGAKVTRRVQFWSRL